MILKEKENYIRKLNNELNELRIENEKLKDKLISYEMEYMGKTFKS
jgi:predicted RNase H-like nuclease (RuvC/YqgF family)